MQRRELLQAVTVVMAATAGCSSSAQTTMSTEKALSKFDDVKFFESPDDTYDPFARFVDEEAGVCLYATNLVGQKLGQGVGLTSVPLDQTNLSNAAEETEDDTPVAPQT